MIHQITSTINDKWFRITLIHTYYTNKFIIFSNNSSIINDLIQNDDDSMNNVNPSPIIDMNNRRLNNERYPL